MATDDKRYPKESPLNDSSPPPPAPTLPTVGGVQGPWVIPSPEPSPAPTLEPLPSGVAGPPGPPKPRGAIRFQEEIRKTGFQSGSEQYDDYVLTKMQPDPTDPEYSYQVNFNRQQAQERQRKREEERNRPPRVADEHATAEFLREPVGANLAERKADVEAKKQAVRTIEYVDAYGNVIKPDKKVATGNSAKPGSQSADAVSDEDLADLEEMTDSEFIGTGNAVWVGDVGQGTGQYRAAGDMMNDIYRWNPAQTAAFQKSIGLEPTGVADEDTVAYWKWTVNTGRYYTAMGQHRTVDSIVQQGKTQVSGRRGGGGGGGGGGGAAIPADAAKRLLNEAMKEFAGREATADELKAFLPAIRAVAGSGDFDANQFATDWVRGGQDGARSGEVANYQAATGYYAVVQQLIGGR